MHCPGRFPPGGSAPIFGAVNVLSPPRARLSIEVVFDLVCPWCFLGIRRLRRALRSRPDVMADMVWRPFLLNPDAGVGGIQRSDYIARRFGGEDRTRRLHATLAELGRVEDIAFRFDLLHRSVSSLDAHRLVRMAARIGRADEAVDRLFTGYFTQGLDIGRQDVLLPLGVSLGLEQATLHRFLSGNAEVEDVHAENLRAHRLGINGVPCFVVSGRHAIAGAQEPEVLERLLDIAITEGEFA